MRTNTGLWWLLAAFFALMAVVYTTWSIIAHPDLASYTASSGSAPSRCCSRR